MNVFALPKFYMPKNKTINIPSYNFPHIEKKRKLRDQLADYSAPLADAESTRAGSSTLDPGSSVYGRMQRRCSSIR